MATCPECLAAYADDVQTCPQHGCALVPDELAVASEAPLPAGTMVGEYRIDHKLGAGTFGDVYAGEQPVIGKRVAVKVLNRRFASDPVMVSRFVAEARAVNKIRQRNIIDIFSFGTLPGKDRHYFVMELLDGLTLGALLGRTGRLPVALVLPVVRGIADALDAVHDAGITHRDLKPDNVFLAQERDGSYFPKLLDFGIAKLMGEDAAHKTGSGMVLGTPRYMSPEQARGKPADHRADIYALGVMIHEMLTGAPLFTGDSAVDMLLKHAVDPPPRLSSVCPDLPPALDAPVLAMLQKRPQDRPVSAGKAVSALAACARELGLDHATVTLAELAAGDVRTQRTVLASSHPPGAQTPGAPYAGTTLTIDRPRAIPVSSPPKLPAPTPVSTPARADPMSKTERAPVSSPKDGGTLLSRQPVEEARSADSSPRANEGPTTESVSALDTSSAIKRRGRARWLKVAAGSVAVLAVGVAVWALRSPSPRVAAVTAPSPPSAAPSAAPSEREVEPTVKPDLGAPEVVTTPAQPVTSSSTHRDAPGPPARPVSSPSHTTAKPAGSAGKLDRILGGRD